MRTNITGNLGILAVALVLVPRATRAEPVVIPAAPDLEAEWKLQFEDLRIQMASLDLQGKEIDHLKMTRARALKRAQSESFRDSATILPTDRDPLDILLRRTEAVLREVLRLAPKADLAGAGTELSKLREQAARTDPAAEARYDLFAKVCLLRRRITLANPLLDFRDIVFVTRGPATSHMVPQYMAQSNSAGGGLWVLEDAFAAAPRLREVTAAINVSRGRLAGTKLARKAFLSPSLSYDARTICFAYSEKRSTDAAPAPGRKKPRPDWSEGESFHLFRIGVDGRNLEQLTDGPWNDFDPCPLPDGRVAFISERRGGFGRCGVPQTYTLHTMNADGSDIRPISFHETNEWNPSVTHDGLIIYSRWDYVDRGALAAHHPWITTPEGCDARSLRGNWGKVSARGNMEVHVRPVPGSQKFVATAAAHHDESFGSLILIDFQKPDESDQQARRITPEALFPEAGGPFPAREGMFSTAWPLSEDFYLATYQPRTRRPAGAKEPPSRAGIYLVDSFGNRELLYRDPDLGCWNPIPLRQRTVPPTLPSRTKKGELRRMPPVEDRKPWGEVGCGGTTVAGEATVLVVNAYESRRPWPAGTKIKALRVVQLYPKSSPEYGRPWIGVGNQALARGVLGVVPVEEDGSAHFILPAGKPVYFQALDERGLAVQSMLSDAYAQPGEQLTCQGCHEPRYQAPKQPAAMPLAARRPPQRLTREVEDPALDAGQAMPVSFARLVQPVLQRHCVECHARTPKSGSLAANVVAGKQPKPKRYDGWGWSEAYLTLQPFAWTTRRGGGNGGPMISTPGKVGARASKLLDLLSKGHHDVKLPEADLRRITLWLDCDSPFFGAYHGVEKQARGELVLPTLE